MSKAYQAIKRRNSLITNVGQDQNLSTTMFPVTSSVCVCVQGVVADQPSQRMIPLQTICVNSHTKKLINNHDLCHDFIISALWKNQKNICTLINIKKL